MRSPDRDKRGRRLTRYRPAEAIEPDPTRRAASFLVSLGLVASCLVLADAVKCAIRPNAEPFTTPILLGLEDLEGEVKDLDRGDQKVKPDEDKPKTEPVKEKDPTEQPPVVKPDTTSPTGASDSSNPNKSMGIIATKGTGAEAGSLLGARSGTAQEESLGKYGGDAKTQNAVRLGLQWLARHQEEDGSWSRTEFNRHCPRGEACPSGAVMHRAPMDPALTSMAVLCFAAADNTHQRGAFKANIASALAYLRRTQTKAGLFGNFARGVNDYMMYNHAISTFALAELCAMSGDAALKEPLERAVKFLATAQQVCGAWDYTDVKTGRYDTSVTGWVVMALKSAQAAGIEVPPATVFRLARFLDAVTLPNGEVIYANAEPSRGRRGWSIAAVGLASNLFLGYPASSRQARLQMNMMLEHPPDWDRLSDWRRAGVISYDSIYYWYYGTLATFQVGGKAWDQWNVAMKKTLLLHQRSGGCVEGSWDPVDMWGIAGGRIYSTALNILNLEVYYRYLPLYGGGAMKTVDALTHMIERGDRSDAIDAVRLLGKFGEGPARDYLVKLARGDDHQLSFEASVALAETKDTAAIVPLLERLKSSNQFERYRAVRALAPMMGQGLVPVFIGLLRDEKGTVARAADQALRQYAGVSFGFEPESSRDEREAAIGKWEEWWEKRKSGAGKVEPELPWLVVRVAASDGLVVFHTGKPDQAQAGKKYEVFRGTRYVGRLNAVRIDGAVCLAKPLDGLNAAEIQEGDLVKPGS